MNRGDMKMKDIKSYVIGFLTCACLFLIMGQTRYDAIGRYQFAVDSNNNETTYKTYLKKVFNLTKNFRIN